jgi:hypothetical protein
MLIGSSSFRVGCGPAIRHCERSAAIKLVAPTVAAIEPRLWIAALRSQ